jgi:hypothetical protein
VLALFPHVKKNTNFFGPPLDSVRKYRVYNEYQKDDIQGLPFIEDGNTVKDTDDTGILTPRRVLI